MQNYNNNNNNTYYVIQGRVVNKVIYPVLCIFLGGLGVHKFYAGKTTQGILYLLFSWTFIPTILALFTFIATLFKPADANGNIIIQ